jgi:NAD(P)-dependent dehydrogenase (short-subunit alcohol dehydrogenase family)
VGLEGKSAIVTGGAFGLGRSFAIALAGAGATVTVCDVRPEVVETAADLESIGHPVEGLVADVSRPDDVQRVVEDVLRRTGTIDVLVNNAGVVRVTDPTDAWDKALDDYDYLVDTNFKGVFLFGRAVIPVMMAKGEGNIVNIASDHIHTCGWPDAVAHADAPGCPWAASRRSPGWVDLDLYDASKWALNGLTQGWAKSLRAYGIRVNNLCMGATDSHMQRSFFGYGYDDATAPPPEMLAKWMDPARVAELLLELIDEGPQGRSGDNVGLWIGHPTELPPPSPVLNVDPAMTPETIVAPLMTYLGS